MESQKVTDPLPVPAKTAGLSRFRWVVIALCAIVTLINYLDRSAISYAIQPIKQEFGLTDFDFGIVASAFGIGYLIMTVGGGILVDRYGARKIWSASAFLWSLCTAAMGLASSFWILFFLRALLGISEGPHFPSLTRVVADWLPPSERARATAIGLSSVAFASVIGNPLLSNMVASLGWKVMFMLLGVLGVSWSVAWYLIFRDYPEHCQFVSDEELKTIREGQIVDRHQSGENMRASELKHGQTSWCFMLFNPSLMANNVSFFAFGYLVFFAITWLPGYLEETYHLHIRQVGIFLIAPWATAGVLMLCAGWLSDWLWKRTGSKRVARSHLIWTCQLASSLCFIPVMFSHSLEFCILMISLGLGLGMMPNAAFYALNCDLAKDRAATSLGIMDCFFAAAGIIAPSLTGFIVTATGSFSSAFGLMTALSLIGVVSVLIMQRPDREIKPTVQTG